MEIARYDQARQSLFATALFACFNVATPAAAVERHYFIDLNSGTASELENLGDSYPRATDINNGGQVAGYLETEDDSFRRAFLTGPNGRGIVDLGEMFKVALPDGAYRESWAYGSNSDGEVVGYTRTNGLEEAFVTGPNGIGYRRLDLDGRYSQAIGINATGQVVGSFDLPEHAFITGPQGKGMTELGRLGGNGSRAAGINDEGQVVGNSDTAEGFSHAFITGPDGVGMRDLGTLGGMDSFGSAINDEGQVVGYSLTASEPGYHAFITGPDGVGIRDLGTLGGYHYSYAWDINAAGQVAGTFYPKSESAPRAFITGPDGRDIVDLNSLADLPDGVVLIETVGINDIGQVVAVARVIPEPKIYAMLLAGLGLIRFMERRRKISMSALASRRIRL